MKHHGHSRADARNLHLHRAAFAKLRDEPALLQRCRALLETWLASPGQQPSRGYLEQWREMLDSWPLEQIAATVLDEASGQALRQCSPLGPVLSPRERWELLDEINEELRSGPRHHS